MAHSQQIWPHADRAPDTAVIDPDTAKHDGRTSAGSVAESGADCLKVLDAEGCLISVNTLGVCALGLGEFSGPEGVELASMWPKAGRAGIRAAVAEANRSGTGHYYGLCPTALGDPQWWDVPVTRVADAPGQPRRLLAASRNMTERGPVEDQLTWLNTELEAHIDEQTTHYDRMWQLPADVMVVAKLDTTILAVNPAWETVLGWREHELAGTSFVNQVHPDDLGTTIAGTGRIATEQTVSRFENRYLHKDGSYRWMSWAAVADAQLLHAVGRDITTERVALADLVRTQDSLRQAQKMAAVGQLTGGIAHDFNNMLAIVINSLDLLRRQFGDIDPKARRYINNAAEAAKRAETMTRRLLAFSRQHSPAVEVIDADRLINGFSDLIQTSLGGDVMLETVLQGDLWQASVDPNQLENAVLNLSINARDAMPNGGRLMIETANVQIDQLCATGHVGVTPGEYVLITVADTGGGMPVEVLEKVFEPFFTTKGTGKGTGFGLSQVHGFAQQSGGHVNVISQVGQGTTVRVYLPRHLAITAAESRMKPTLLDGKPRQTILVVDDDTDVGRVSAAFLLKAGFHVTTVRSGDEALAMLTVGPAFDALVTDYAMPGMNGVDLVLQARERLPALPALIITGYAGADGLDRLPSDVTILRKPFQRDDLVGSVKGLIEGTTPETQANEGQVLVEADRGIMQ